MSLEVALEHNRGQELGIWLDHVFVAPKEWFGRDWTVTIGKSQGSGEYIS
jgi:hypothetical protein